MEGGFLFPRTSAEGGKFFCAHLKSDFHINVCDVNTPTSMILWHRSLEMNPDPICDIHKCDLETWKTPLHSLRVDSENLLNKQYLHIYRLWIFLHGGEEEEELIILWSLCFAILAWLHLLPAVFVMYISCFEKPATKVSFSCIWSRLYGCTLTQSFKIDPPNWGSLP